MNQEEDETSICTYILPNRVEYIITVMALFYSFDSELALAIFVSINLDMVFQILLIPFVFAELTHLRRQNTTLCIAPIF